MSVTPTDEALIVSLDFEGMFRVYRSNSEYQLTNYLLGVDSIERSRQEDTLLVLFNTAISNLVLWLLLSCLSPNIL